MLAFAWYTAFILAIVGYTYSGVIYTQYKNGTFNKTLFLENTYLGFDERVDPCEFSNRGKYLKKLSTLGIKCSGDWCNKSGEFGCQEDNCYNAMHIIDPTNSDSEFGKEFNKNISGNMIMVYNRWKSQLPKNWEDIKAEKRDVLGVHIFDKAAEYVRRCRQSSSTDVPSQYPSYSPSPSPSPILVPTSTSISAPPTPTIFKHTKTYLEYKEGLFKYEDFFMKSSFLGDNPSLDICEPMSKTRYLTLLKKNNIVCSGKWCNEEGGFGCQVGNSQDCYNQEHIIDLKNSDPEFGNAFEKDILGNFIMAYGRWNQELGRLRDWESIKNEKREIYRSEIFDKAYKNVKECHAKSTPQPSSLEKDDDSISDTSIESSTAKFIIYVVAFAVIGGVAYRVYRTQYVNTITTPVDDVEMDLPPKDTHYDTYENYSEDAPTTTPDTKETP